MPLRSFNDNRFIFEEVEHVADGLGPTFNAQSCRECHQNIVTGGASQVAEHRTGRLGSAQFFESLGGSLIQSRSTNPDIFERVPFEDSVRTFRISTNTLGAGFVEAIANDTLLAIRNAQPAAIRGTALEVPVLEANNAPRIGRFGWKSQHASLRVVRGRRLSERDGHHQPLLPEENTSIGRFVGFGTPFDPVPDPEDDGVDVRGVRELHARDQGAAARADHVGRARRRDRCSTRSAAATATSRRIVTAPPGTRDQRRHVRACATALGNKIIHPYSDFLLHDIGTGDGIPVLPGAEFASTATRFARRRSGRCVRATGSCTTASRSRCETRSSGTPVRRRA